MKIQFFSDIHLEFGDFELPCTDADVIVAAGDIGVGTQGAEWLMKADRPVVYVAGNHEFYGGDLVDTREAIADYTEGSHVAFLENNVCVIGDTRFIGCTLWTDFSRANPVIMSIASKNMNDYYHISYLGEPLMPEDILDVHISSANWMRQVLSQAFDGKTVVVSHHAPCTRSWYSDPESPLMNAYCTELLRDLEGFTVDLWIHGHIHVVSDYQQYGVRVTCNPRGYNGYQYIDDFDAARVVKI